VICRFGFSRTLFVEAWEGRIEKACDYKSQLQAAPAVCSYRALHQPLGVIHMSFFISDALAEAAPAAATQGDPFTALLFPIGLIALFYFFLIRPQSKRAKEHKKMTEELQKGDEVVTQGGILGKITNVGENFISIEIANDVTINVQKASVGALMPKGTLKEVKKD